MKKVLLATLFAAFSLGMSAQAFEYVPLDANTGRPLVPNVPSVPSVPSIQSYGFGAPTPPRSQTSWWVCESPRWKICESQDTCMC